MVSTPVLALLKYVVMENRLICKCGPFPQYITIHMREGLDIMEATPDAQGCFRDLGLPRGFKSRLLRK